jgi:CRISPR-associated protein Cmr1
LSWIGQALSRFRSCYGDKNARFRPDHHLFYDVISRKDPARCPERHVFGLPHNYFTPKSGKHKMDVPAEQVKGHRPDGSEVVEAIERRGSPLFIRLHRLADGNLVALLAFLPARVLPQNSRLVMASDNGHVFRHSPPVPPNWSPINDFLRRFTNPDVRIIKPGATVAV